MRPVAPYLSLSSKSLSVALSALALVLRSWLTSFRMIWLGFKYGTHGLVWVGFITVALEVYLTAYHPPVCLHLNNPRTGFSTLWYSVNNVPGRPHVSYQIVPKH